jgi:hypothetical protein
MPLAAALWGVAALLSIALLAVPACRSRAAHGFNTLQFLTIRQYLSLVFGALVAPLLVISIWR